MRKVMWLVCVAVWLFSLPTVVSAADNRGSIRIKLETGDLPVINGAVTLYQVGIKMEEGYRITEGFGAGIVRKSDADSEKLAQWLAESVEEAGMSMLLDADGNAVFSELEEGLYMLVQTERIDGFYPIYPVLLTIPQEENWDVLVHKAPVPVVTELPKTGQSPIPFLGVLGMVLSATGLLLCRKKIRD